MFLGLIQQGLLILVLEDETEKKEKVDFSLYTNQLLNVPFSGIIIIIINIIIIIVFIRPIKGYIITIIKG